MKGIELPINILVIVAVAVIVLIALIAMFYPAFSSGSQTVGLESAKAQACRSLIANNCGDPNDVGVINFDANKDEHTWDTLTEASDSGDHLFALCVYWLQTTDPDDCKALCGC